MRPPTGVVLGNHPSRHQRTTTERSLLNIPGTWGEVQVEVVCGNHGRLGKVAAKHPFFISANRRVAGDLWPGARLRRADGAHGTVPRRPQVMYNLTVAEAHTYFVGDGQWLVRNECRPRPYGGPGGGHHIHSKKAFEVHPYYDGDKALALRNAEMLAHNYVHMGRDSLTVRQQQLPQEPGRDVAAETRRNTMLEYNRIAVEALVAGGVPRVEARHYVAQSLRNRREMDVRYPTRIPWVGPSPESFK